MKYNLNNLKDGKTNICFITGLSGSGKTTLAKTISKKYGYIHINLDDFEQCHLFKSLKEIKTKCGDVFYIYFLKHRNLYEKLRNKDIYGEKLCSEIKKFLYFVIDYCNNDNEKYILDGVQIYSFLEPDILHKHSFIIINENMISCIYRRIKRNYKYGYKFSELEPHKMIKWYIQELKIFTRFYHKI